MPSAGHFPVIPYNQQRLSTVIELQSHLLSVVSCATLDDYAEWPTRGTQALALDCRLVASFIAGIRSVVSLILSSKVTAPTL